MATAGLDCAVQEEICSSSIEQIFPPAQDDNLQNEKKFIFTKKNEKTYRVDRHFPEAQFHSSLTCIVFWRQWGQNQKPVPVVQRGVPGTIANPTSVFGSNRAARSERDTASPFEIRTYAEREFRGRKMCSAASSGTPFVDRIGNSGGGGGAGKVTLAAHQTEPLTYRNLPVRMIDEDQFRLLAVQQHRNGARA